MTKDLKKIRFSTFNLVSAIVSGLRLTITSFRIKNLKI